MANENGRMRWLIAGITVMLSSLIAWGSWCTVALIRLEHQLEVQTLDRFTASMFIEVQDELSARNPDNRWLNAAEVRIIQERNAPYSRQPR